MGRHPTSRGLIPAEREFVSDEEMMALVETKTKTVLKRRRQVRSGEQRVHKRLSVCNVTGTFDFRVRDLYTGKLDFEPEWLSLIFPNCKNDPAQFPKIILRLQLSNNLQVGISVVAKNKAVIAGSTTQFQLQLAYAYFTKAIESIPCPETGKQRYRVESGIIAIRNWVLSGQLPHYVNTMKLYRGNLKLAKYNPTKFPGVSINIGAATVSVFDTGAVCICGMAVLTNVKTVWQVILNLVKGCELASISTNTTERSNARIAIYNNEIAQNPNLFVPTADTPLSRGDKRRAGNAVLSTRTKNPRGARRRALAA